MFMWDYATSPKAVSDLSQKSKGGGCRKQQNNRDNPCKSIHTPLALGFVMSQGQTA